MEKELNKYSIEAGRAVEEMHPGELKDYAEYHEVMVKNFQHERLIHLIVTLFFAGAFLLFFVATLLFHIFVDTNTTATAFISISLSAIVVILLITTVFYIRHYYQLENGTQKLYKLSKAIYDKNHNND